MSVRILMLAALHEVPREKTFIVAGSETINMHGKIQTITFSHVLQNPEKLTEANAKPGDLLYIEASVTPMTNRPGQVLIFPRFIQNLGQQGVEKDDHGKFIRVGGFNNLLAGGTVVGRPVVENFNFGQKKTTLHLATDTRGGLLQITSYGLTAEHLGSVPEGHYLNLQGRLAYETRKDPLGRDLFTAYVEMSRSDALPPRKEKKKPKPKGAVQPSEKPAANQKSTKESNNTQKETKESTKQQPQTAQQQKSTQNNANQSQNTNPTVPSNNPSETTTTVKEPSPRNKNKKEKPAQEKPEQEKPAQEQPTQPTRQEAEPQEAVQEPSVPENTLTTEHQPEPTTLEILEQNPALNPT